MTSARRRDDDEEADVPAADGRDLIGWGLDSLKGGAEGHNAREALCFAPREPRRFQTISIAGKRPKAVESSTRGLAMALMREGGHDFKPELLALMWWGDESGLKRIVTLGGYYVQAWGRAVLGRDYPADVCLAAAADGLDLTMAGRASRGPRTHTSKAHSEARLRARHRTPVDERARELGIRKNDFSKLRRAADTLFTNRLTLAVKRFRVVNDWHPEIILPDTAPMPGLTFHSLPAIDRVDLTGPAAMIYCMRHPSVPPTDWIHRVKAPWDRLSTAKRYDISRENELTAFNSDALARRAA